MKKIYIVITLLLITFNSIAFAQFKDWGSKFGVRYNQIFPENEFRNVGFGGNDDLSFKSYHFSFLAEVLYAVELSNPLEVEFNLGYGKYAGEAYCNEIDQGEYNTTILPFDIRIKVNPFDLESWNPFVYAGVGVFHYISHTKPEGLDCNFEKTIGWEGLFPVGIGSEFSVSDNFLLEISLGGTLTTTYELDGFRGRTEEIWDSYFNTSVGLLYVVNNCKTDKDNDRLLKCDEEKIGTDPENPDTDKDGLNDGVEFLTYKTDPLKFDSDDDGLNDNEETNNYNTNPLLADTDSDALSDFVEVTEYKTNPLNSDSDTDELTDGEEIGSYKTNPLLADTDVDGLSDSEEIKSYKTNPLKKDTDNGSIDDLAEVKRKSDPLNPKDDVAVEKKIEKFVFDGITFGFDKTNITKESEQVLLKALNILENYISVHVEISGHTDSKGTKKYNQILSERRAAAVRDWLVNHGINAERLIPVGYGFDKPVVPNTTKANRQKNRRCELKQIN
ncbi:MAG: OmpA family protein [Ignavibacteriales bacterium]|nr:OmpA family protein [Ignavibacteriales bacterium]